jgi:hypothetical protein
LITPVPSDVDAHAPDQTGTRELAADGLDLV